jgi:hypothetical protein
VDSNLLFVVLVVFIPALYAWGMPQVCVDRKSLNAKRLSLYSRNKSVAESFRGWDLLFRFWDAVATLPRNQNGLRFWQNHYCR